MWIYGLTVNVAIRVLKEVAVGVTARADAKAAL
jgi:hypothetical protein